MGPSDDAPPERAVLGGPEAMLSHIEFSLTQDGFFVYD
jgi:hypothetical protein